MIHGCNWNDTRLQFVFNRNILLFRLLLLPIKWNCVAFLCNFFTQLNLCSVIVDIWFYHNCCVVSLPILSNNNYPCSSVLHHTEVFVVVLSIILCFSYQCSSIRDALCYNVKVCVMGVDCRSMLAMLTPIRIPCHSPFCVWSYWCLLICVSCFNDICWVI